MVKSETANDAMKRLVEVPRRPGRLKIRYKVMKLPIRVITSSITKIALSTAIRATGLDFRAISKKPKRDSVEFILGTAPRH